ncbi:MAG: hypothetical protein O3A12_01230 [Actinobacteria bacterium]|nr:hypothetical protein [Actinomycetota bacterium]MDA2984262.1 hypothetical protein [Actinomycetota bacterium]
MNNNSLLPNIATSFFDFELEEIVVQFLSRIGYQILHRQISDQVINHLEHQSKLLLFTDRIDVKHEFVITIPREAKFWEQKELLNFLHNRLFQRASSHVEKNGLVITGSDSYKLLFEDFNSHFSDKHPIRHHFSFNEEDLDLALLPTRRNLEIDRIQKLQEVESVLYIFQANRHELASAHTFIEYQRRIHNHLSLAFLPISFSSSSLAKKVIAEISAALDPFPIFLIRLSHRELERSLFHRRSLLELNPKIAGALQFKEIEKWLGSTRGISKRTKMGENNALTRGSKAPWRTDSRVAITG